MYTNGINVFRKVNIVLCYSCYFTYKKGIIEVSYIDFRDEHVTIQRLHAIFLLYICTETVTGCSAQEKALIGFFPAAAILIFVLAVFLILLLLFRNHIHIDFKKSMKCSDSVKMERGETVPGHDEQISIEGHAESTAIVNASQGLFSLRMSPSGRHYTVVTATDLASPKYSNPIANMLVKVAFLIGDNQVELNQDMAVISAIDHILGEVLTGDTCISMEAGQYMEDMKIEVTRYAAKIRQRRLYRRNLSRSSAITPGSMGTPATTPLATNHVIKHPLSIRPSIEEVDEAIELDSQPTASQPEDMVDGMADSDSDSDSEECHQIKIAKDISEKLYEWLSRQRQKTALKTSTDHLASASDCT